MDMFRVQSDHVRPLDRDPELLDGLDDATAAHLRLRVTTPVVRLDAGPYAPADTTHAAPALGLLVLDGFLLRTVSTAGRSGSEVMGPGDLVLTHAQIGRLTCLGRASVCAGMALLRDAGAVSRTTDGWMLHGAPPSVAEPVVELLAG